MNISFAFWFLLCFYSYVESTGIWHNTRIVGGRPANIEDYPYQLAIEDLQGFAFCGASIIARLWAVTAAHCVVESSERDMLLRSGASKRNTNGTLHKVEKIIVHPNYNTTSQDYDVSLIKVSTPFNFSDVAKKISLANETPPVGASAVVTGYGLLKFGGDISVHLQRVTVFIVDHEECEKNYGHNGTITPSMMCAGVPQGGKDACSGDSGGPLAIGDELVGIVSWGLNCAAKGYPGVYTDVAKVRNWISSTIEKQ